MSLQGQLKKKTSDFRFGKCIGEGSFSEVFLAKEISTNQEYAIKVLVKKQILREKKQKYVHREKEVLLKLDHPFFIKLHFTFQDEEKLYFGLSYACNGELLDHIKHLGKFDVECAKFYSAEIITALEYLHSLSIIHRDMKPENILLDANMHIQITDFGSAKILMPEELSCSETVPDDVDQCKTSRRHSFVGTAQYVSPEVLNSNYSCFSSDLWALGCIIYQFLTGNHPFTGSNEYQIFNKIIKLDYDVPPDLDDTSKDLIRNLLVLQPNRRLGCKEMGGYESLRSHSFFSSTAWDSLEKQCPPLKPLAGKSTKESPTDPITVMTKSLDLRDAVPISQPNIDFMRRDSLRKPGAKWFTKEERNELLKKQSASNIYHKFVEGNLIIKQGYLYKKKGLIPRRRMFLLTEGPRLFYVDPANLILKGEVPWSRDLKPEAKDFRVFHIHTPNRIYFLEDPDGNALKWCAQIEDVSRHYFDTS